MIPWTLDHLIRVLVGMGTSDESRLDNLLQLNPEGAPSFETNQKLLNGSSFPRRSTYEKKGLGFVHEFLSDDLFKKLPENLRFRDIISLSLSLAAKYETHSRLSVGANFLPDLAFSFPRLLSSIMRIESMVHGEETQQAYPNIPTKLPAAEFLKVFEGFDAKKKALVGELHAFLVYFAAAELDFAESENQVRIALPSSFIPSYYAGSLRYPMETFWEWLKLDAGYTEWTEFADAIGTTTAMLSKYRKATSLDPSASHNQLQTFCRNLWPHRGLSRRSQKLMEIRFSYGIVRILQEHAHRCVPLILEYYCDAPEIERFYLTQIAECKKWVQDMHPAPMLRSQVTLLLALASSGTLSTCSE